MLNLIFQNTTYAYLVHTWVDPWLKIILTVWHTAAAAYLRRCQNWTEKFSDLHTTITRLLWIIHWHEERPPAPIFWAYWMIFMQRAFSNRHAQLYTSVSQIKKYTLKNHQICETFLSNCCEVNLFLRHWHFQKTPASQKKFSTFMYEKRPLRTYHRPNHTTSSGTIIRMLFWIRIQRIFVRRQAVKC